MLTEPSEIAIIARASQAGVRDPTRSRRHFVHIFEDFLAGVQLSGQRVLDIGPGQYDFGVIAGERGARVVGIDRDPAVLELGRHKGFDVIDADFRESTAAVIDGPYDGMFCKYSLNAFWFSEDLSRVHEHVGAFLGALRDDGWGWIAPWNRAPEKLGLHDAELDAVLEAQIDAFSASGFAFHELTEEQTRRYGVHGATANNALFTRGL